MYKVHYRLGRSALMALFLGMIALLFVNTSLDSKGSWISLAFCLLIGAGAAKCAYDAITDAPALMWDASGVSIRRGFRGTTVVPWRMVQGIGLEVQTMRYMMVIPVARHEYLTIHAVGGISGTRSLQLPAAMLRLAPGGLPGLIQQLSAAHVAALQGAPDVSWREGGPKLASEPEAPGFDPDAALARYLARKEAGAAPELPLAAMAAPAPTPAPARPVFGRKSQAR